MCKDVKAINYRCYRTKITNFNTLLWFATAEKSFKRRWKLNLDNNQITKMRHRLLAWTLNKNMSQAETKLQGEKKTVRHETTIHCGLPFEMLRPGASSTDLKVRTTLHTLYSIINSTTWKYCSIAFIWLVTLYGFISRLEGWNHLAQHNKQYHIKVLLNGFHLNGHTLGFHPQT